MISYGTMPAETKMETIIDAFLIVDELPVTAKNDKLKINLSRIFGDLQRQHPRIAKRVLERKGCKYGPEKETGKLDESCFGAERICRRNGR